MSVPADYERPTWHTDESWSIETLDWRNDPRQFERLVTYVTAQLEPEVSERGQRLFEFVTLEELRDQIRVAAERYEERHRSIGLAIHATLRARAYVATKMRGENWT
jgi:hypothetical protein